MDYPACPDRQRYAASLERSPGIETAMPSLNTHKPSCGRFCSSGGVGGKLLCKASDPGVTLIASIRLLVSQNPLFPRESGPVPRH